MQHAAQPKPHSRVRAGMQNMVTGAKNPTSTKRPHHSALASCKKPTQTHPDRRYPRGRLNRARFYHAELGRFISRDPVGYIDGFNLYRAYFVPEKVDPFGTLVDPITGAAAGTVIITSGSSTGIITTTTGITTVTTSVVGTTTVTEGLVTTGVVGGTVGGGVVVTGGACVAAGGIGYCVGWGINRICIDPCIDLITDELIRRRNRRPPICREPRKCKQIGSGGCNKKQHKKRCTYSCDDGSKPNVYIWCGPGNWDPDCDGSDGSEVELW